MLAGPGISTLIKLPKTDGPSGYRIAIMRLSTDGANPAGTWDSDPTSADWGTYLHLRAVFPTCGANRCVNDSGAVPPLMDWDPEGIEIFPPECTQLTAVGGLGLYGIMAEQVPIVHAGYAPRSRRLLRYLERFATFRVPPGHAGIGCNDSTATLTNISDGGTINLTSAWPYLIAAGTLLGNAGANPLLVWTSFNA